MTNGEIYNRKAPKRALDAIVRFAPNLIITGQTKLAENFVFLLSLKREFLIARYSYFYPRKKGHGFQVLGGETFRGRRYERTLESVGYSLDIPKNPEIIYEFLNDLNILQAISRKDKKELVDAIEEFNKGKEKQVIITSFFKEIWKN